MTPELVTAYATAVFVNNLVFSDEDKILKFVFVGLHSKEVDERISHGQSRESAACSTITDHARFLNDASNLSAFLFMDSANGT